MTTTNKIWFGGVRLHLAEHDLTDYFTQFGKVIKCLLLRNKKTKESRGFGFIDFAEADSAKKCLSIHEHFCDGRKFNCKEAIPVECSGLEEKQAQERKVWVGSLDSEWTDVTMKDYFSNFGEIDTCYIAREKGSEVSRKFGFVFFKSVESVSRVLDIASHSIKGIHVEVKALKSRKNWSTNREGPVSQTRDSESQDPVQDLKKTTKATSQANTDSTKDPNSGKNIEVPSSTEL